MKRTALAAMVTALFLGNSAWVVYSQGARPPVTFRTQQVKGDLHMVSGEGGNVALLATKEGVLLVDNMFDRSHDAILEQMKTVTAAPLRYVINTHQHDDHAGGDFRMLPMAEVIAHRNVYANLKDLKRPYYEDRPGTPIGLPRVTFSDRLDVHLGGIDVEAYYFGRGHTSGDVIVYFPQLKTIHTGDLFIMSNAKGLPIYVDSNQGGSLLEWSRTLERTLALDFDTIIPGHGPVATKGDLATFNAAIVAMRTRMQGLVKQGTSRDEIVRILEADYGWRSKGCPPPPNMTPGCLQYQQVDGLIAELRGR